MALNELIDTNVRYAEVSDVERYIRNQTFDTNSDPTKSEVQSLLDDASELIDTRTKRAWRMRKVKNREIRVKFSHKQSSAAQRRRSYPFAGRARGRSAAHNPVAERGVANLPNMQLQSFDSAQGDKVEILKPNSVKDITANEGRDQDEGFYVDERHGLLHIDIENFLVGPIYGSGMIDRPRVRVTYRYGTDESGNTLSSSVPGDVQSACAQLAAADLVETDQYGSVIASGPENTPDQSSAAQRMRESAMATLDAYTYKRRL